jgi:hypothetical protein
MEIRITEVTEMHNDSYCVAGWCAALRRMVRPLPGGSNWTASLLQIHKIAPGATVRVTPTNLRLAGSYPHLTEDTAIDSTTIQLVSTGPEPWFAAGAPPYSLKLADAFEGHLSWNSIWQGNRQGAHVKPGVKARSLTLM